MYKWKDKKVDNLSTNKLIKNSSAYGLLLLAILAMTFFGVCDSGGPGAGVSGAAARVGDVAITKQEFSRAYSNTLDQVQRQKGSDFKPEIERVAQRVMNQLITERVNYQFASSIGLRASDEEVQDILLKEEYFKGDNGKFDAKKFSEYLKFSRTSEKQLLEDLRRSQTVAKLRSFIASSAYTSKKAALVEEAVSKTKLDLEYVEIDPAKLKVEVSSKEIEEFIGNETNNTRIESYYNANQSQYSQPEKVRARHVLVSFKGARNASGDGAKRSKADAEKRAKEVLGLVKKPEADFAAIAKRWTDEQAGKTSGGDLGEFKFTDMVEPFSKAAFALSNPGDISEIVESPFGFHIIKLEKKIAKKDVTLEQAKKDIAKVLIERDKKPNVEKELADSIKANLADAEKLKGVLAQNKLTWQSTGEFNLSSRYIKGIGYSEGVFDALVTIKNAGDIYPELVSSQGKTYLLKLKSRSQPKLDEIKEEDIERASRTLSFRNGYSVYSVLEKSFRAKLEEENALWMNPEYLALDQPQNNPGT